MSVQASCSRCDFKRRFADELGGKYYRCPKCRKGVISVPIVDMSESEEVPLRLSSSSFENPFLAVANRKPQGMRETMELSDTGSTAEGTGVAKKTMEGPGSATDPDMDRPRKKPQLKATLDDAGATLKEDVQTPVPAEEDRSDGTQKIDPEDHRGKVAMARRILVECGLCGYYVRIPPEFFGKTVHCPECAGNTIFSESTLDPVKDELLDRLIMETAERRVLFPKDAPGAKSSAVIYFERIKKAMGNNALRSFMVGVGLGLVVLLGAYFIVSAKREAARRELVERAEENGWRYATATGSSDTVFHEPWCQELEGGAGLRLSEASFKERGTKVVLHECD